MKKQYIQPISESVNIHLNNSVLDDEERQIGGPSNYAMTMWGNENKMFDDEDEDINFANSSTSLWDE